jgi:molybdopterin-containing oxidoreductase family membrane subunit
MDRAPAHHRSYPRVLLRLLALATDGGPAFYAWMTLLTAVALVGANAWAHQVAEGMALTHLSDHVSWGLYIANFTFGVGLAAAGVLMVVPAYLYHDRDMHDVVILGEILAIAAIVVCLGFVTVDLGRPDRVWHLLPGIGRFHWPISMLTWDIIVLNGYLLLNLHIVGYLLWCRFRGQAPARRWYLPFVMLSIVWAISIHTVTAFLYAGLGGRPFWNSALLAPRFLASAFVSGPALIILLLLGLRRGGLLRAGAGAVETLVGILRITAVINLFMLASEVFVELYTGGHHGETAAILLWGAHGYRGLQPWIWSAITLNVGAAAILLWPGLARRHGWLALACVATFCGVWIEKGMGLIVPAFVPSTLGELADYAPSLVEWKVSAGVWALGAMVLTVGVRAALGVSPRAAR